MDIDETNLNAALSVATSHSFTQRNPFSWPCNDPTVSEERNTELCYNQGNIIDAGLLYPRVAAEITPISYLETLYLHKASSVYFKHMSGYFKTMPEPYGCSVSVLTFCGC